MRPEEEYLRKTAQMVVEPTKPDDLSAPSNNYSHVEVQPDWGYMRKRVEAQKATERAKATPAAYGPQPKERWEIIERLVLLAATICFVGSAAWLFFVRPDPVRVFSGYMLSILAFWTVWQMLYEDRLGTSEPVTWGERVMAAIWMVHRALAVGVVGLVTLVVAILELTSIRAGSDLWFFGALFFLAVGAGWVAIFGAGRSKSISDDRSVHHERVRRYKR